MRIRAMELRHGRTGMGIVGGLFAAAMTLTGCTSMQPVYGMDGQVQGYREEFDAGRTLMGLGGVLLGTSGLAVDPNAACDAADLGRTLQATGAAVHYNR